MNMLRWPHKFDNGRYESGWFIGSEEEDGSHRRDASGWPFSVYRKAAQAGVTDAVICHGIQDFEDALGIANALDALRK